MARPVHPSAVYQSPTMTYPSTTYQSAPVVHPPSAYTPTTNAPPTYQFAPAHPASHFQFAPTTNPLPAYQYASTTHHSPSHQSSPTTHSTLPRGRRKNKCFWEESETELLLDVLQDMANDPSWKTDNGFRTPTCGCSMEMTVDKKVACEKTVVDNYCKNHKEAKGLWDVPFPYFNKLELVYGKDRATGIEAEGFEDAIHNLENEFNAESGGDNLGESHFSLRFNANFGTMANAVAHAMTDENTRQKAANEKLKDVLVELMKLKISSGDVLHQSENICCLHKEKIDLFLSLARPPEEVATIMNHTCIS
ncbi:hypothetical protein Tco_0698343 [Tanacetum coccineum]